MPNIFRKKSDDRVAWGKVKTKYAKELKASKLKFTDKLGPALDKLVALELKDYKTPEQKTAVTQAAARQAKVVKGLAQGYLDKIKGLGDPAEKDLRKQLEKIHTDAAFYDFLGL